MKKLKDILDMETYLDKRCYCPGEIYSPDGFFYQIFSAESECEIIGENENHIIVIATSVFENSKPQIIDIYKSEDKTTILDAFRCDATENNIAIFKKLMAGVPVKTLKEQGAKFDEYVNGSTAKSLQEILNMADAICID